MANNQVYLDHCKKEIVMHKYRVNRSSLPKCKYVMFYPFWNPIFTLLAPSQDETKGHPVECVVPLCRVHWLQCKKVDCRYKWAHLESSPDRYCIYLCVFFCSSSHPFIKELLVLVLVEPLFFCEKRVLIGPKNWK